MAEIWKGLLHKEASFTPLETEMQKTLTPASPSQRDVSVPVLKHAFTHLISALVKPKEASE